MKEIPLTQGKVALVDDEDYEWLNQWKWFAFKGHKTYYARRAIYIHGKQKMLHLHRIIMNTPDDMQVDHIDHNGLNNQKSNLRNCDFLQNRQNSSARGKSEYLGVSIKKKISTYKNINGEIKKYYYPNMFVSQITVNKRRTHLGYFNDKIEAAKAYDKAAKEYFGEFANLNFK
jgi:hypothetical protein